MERCRIAPRPNLPRASVISPSANHFESQTANIDMKYYQIFCDIAEALMPLTMLINGFSLGWLVADHFNEKANAKKLGDKKDGDGEPK